MMHVGMAIILFLLAAILHLLYCRQTTAKGLQAKVFLVIVLGVLMFMEVLFIFIPFDPWGPAPTLRSGQALPLTATTIYLLLIPAYLIFYVTTDLLSPSKKILKILQTQGKADYNQLLSAIKADNMIEGRLQELIVSSCAYKRGWKFFLTPHGNKLLMIVKLYRWLCGRSMAG